MIVSVAIAASVSVWLPASVSRYSEGEGKEGQAKGAGKQWEVVDKEAMRQQGKEAGGQCGRGAEQQGDKGAEGEGAETTGADGTEADHGSMTSKRAPCKCPQAL
eukprot:13909705-Alexandrium_andersonii.AAC.1